MTKFDIPENEAFECPRCNTQFWGPFYTVCKLCTTQLRAIAAGGDELLRVLKTTYADGLDQLDDPELQDQ